MSADLFAEFGSFSSSSPQQPDQPVHSHSKPAANISNDPFDFLASPAAQTASPQTYPAPAPQWPSIQTQQNGNNVWGDFGTFGSTTNTLQQQPVQESGDDDDGWGDFEEAPSSTTTSKPTLTLPSPSDNGLAQPQNKPIQAAPPASATKSTFSLLTGPMSRPTVTSPGTKVATETLTRNRITRADTMDLMSNSLVELGDQKSPQPWQARPSWEKAAPAKSSNLSPSAKPSQPSTEPVASRPKIQAVNSDILFDADEYDGATPEEGDDDDDDDFGDFETGEQPAPAKETSPPAQTAMDDLLSLDFSSAPDSQAASVGPPVPAPTQTRKQPPTQLLSTLSLGSSQLCPDPLYPQAPRSPSFSDRNPFPGLAVTTPISGTFPPELKDDQRQKSPTPITAWPEAQSATTKKDWDAFADFPPDASSATPGGPSALSSNWDWDAVDVPQSVVSLGPTSKSDASPEESVGPPPTNVPPPSILLSIFLDIMGEADARLYKPVANQAPTVKTRVFSDPVTLDYLKSYLLLAAVAARIVAGRKLRWNRDKFLAQGMSISAAGSKGGMKLAGVDKAQTAREDREAADVVGVWRDNVGKLKNAVAAANIALQKQPVKMEPLKVPEINDHMAVTTAKMVATAPKPCVVCGLKRAERVKGVDFEVEDSFGEWWVDHWGHRACRNFWLGNEARLRSR